MLNELPAEQAHQQFLDCCGSSEWARRMTADRPYDLVEKLFTHARQVWFSLSRVDQLEAFAAHPKIGAASGPATSVRSGEWSSTEQAGVNDAGDRILDELAEANRLYEKKFGFIFIVFATGKTAEEMLAMCRARYGNSTETELEIAAEEQYKITELRLTKLLER